MYFPDISGHRVAPVAVRIAAQASPMRSICPARPPLVNLFEDALGVLDCISDSTLLAA